MKKQLVAQLLRWSENFSDLPWRKKRSLYHTLVSEIMLQQTTVPTVLPRFSSFIRLFPDLSSLARAKEEAVLSAWKGLGYYRRARHLHQAAKDILENYQGSIPSDPLLLKKIKGIGDYTANALLAIGMDLPILAVDANLERVLARYYCLDAEKGLPLKKIIHQQLTNDQLASALKQWGGRKLNEAFMDLGREICLANNPRCNECPLTKECLAWKNNKTKVYPRLNRSALKAKEQRAIPLVLLRLIVKNKNGLLAEKRPKGKWLENHLELPTFVIEVKEEKFTQYPALPDSQRQILNKKIPQFKTTITKYKITNLVCNLSITEWKKWNHEIEKERYEYYQGDSLKLLSTASLKALKFSEKSSHES